jgi:hypothetical protein
MTKKDEFTSTKTAHPVITMKKCASTTTPVSQVGADSMATSFPWAYTPGFFLMAIR